MNKPFSSDDVLSIIRETNARGFGLAGLKLPEASQGFRPLALARAPMAAPERVLEPEAVMAPPVSSPPDPSVLIAAARAEGHSAGHAEGLTEGRSTGRAAAEAELAILRATMEAALARLAAPTAADTAALAAALDQAVRRLASERAGSRIDEMPEPFLERIEAMADRVAQGIRQVSLRLNPDDLAAVQPFLSGSDLLSGATLQSDPRLARGDVEIRAEGIRLVDVLATGDCA